MLSWLCPELCAVIAQHADYQSRVSMKEVNGFWKEVVSRELVMSMTSNKWRMNRYQAYFLDNLKHRRSDLPVICVGHRNMGKRTAIIQSIFDSSTPNVVVWTYRPTDPVWSSFTIAPTSQTSKQANGSDVYSVDGPSIIVIDIRPFDSDISVNLDGSIAHLIDADPTHVSQMDVLLPALLNQKSPIRICANRSDWIVDRYKRLSNFETLMPTYVGEIVHNTAGPKVPLSYQFLWDKFCRAMKIVTDVTEKNPDRSFTLLCSSRLDASNMAKWLRECAPSIVRKSKPNKRLPTPQTPSFIISTIRAAVTQPLIDTSDVVYVDSPKTSTMTKLESKLNFARHRVVYFWYVGPDTKSVSDKKAWKVSHKKKQPVVF
jgi:hypothetical protein